MKIFRRNETDRKQRAGYSAEYIADLRFATPIDSASFILVRVPKGTSTTPHVHEELEEVFITLDPVKLGIGESLIELEMGDIALVEPTEKHWIESRDEEATLFAIKLPHSKDDKISG